ncbi:MAG: ABC transporter permease, partial [Gemmatimonadetes bacterium]|nr:ABC transporter permease [Gemmatimonadota bacterium]
YFRNRQAIFWALFFPLLIMVIFGLLDFGRYNPPSVGIDDRAGNQASGALLAALRGSEDSPVLNVEMGRADELLLKVTKGDLDAVFVIPEGFGEPGRVSVIEASYDSGSPQEAQVARTVLREVLEGVFQRIAGVPPEYLTEHRFQVKEVEVEGHGQGYKGFLVPGIAAMALMQGGIFGVVFSLVRFRAQGVLRRLKATPISPAHFLVGQLITRLIISVAQTFILLLVGAVVLGVTIGQDAGSWALLAMFAVLGGALFISLGLAISGTAKNEDTAAPVSNIIAMPMMFLSGVFFPVSALPDWLSAATRHLPLTYLADGMRAVAVERAVIGDVVPEILGLAIWTAVMFAISARTFRWE